MGIVDEDIERVRLAADVVAIIGEHVALRRSGSRWVGLCPFHAEKSGSFSVNAELGLYYCFGCQAKGDVITFVREINHLDFAGALELLAGRAGIQLRYDNEAQSGARRKRGVLVEAMTKAVEWYHDRLLNSPDAATARGYLRSRGYDGEIVRRFKLGWAPDDWDQLCRALDVPAEVLRETGLGFVNRRDRMQDSFRGRILFPIFDVRGDAVAIGGRIMPGAEGPKYKNSPATAIYDKSEVLYGLNWAKTQVVERGEVVVCEGYTDVIGMTQAGIERAVATCGTAFTERHVALLKGFSLRIVLAFDADAAGQNAAERFYEWERRYDVDVFVAAMPVGSDPGELAQRDPELLEKAVREAMPFLAFRLDRLLAAANLSTPEGRARAAKGAVDLIAEHPNQLVRDQYLMQVADSCRSDPTHLRDMLATAQGGSASKSATRLVRSANTVASKGDDRPSLMALRLAVQRPEEVADLLDEVLFDDEMHLRAYRALVGATTFQDALAAADPEVVEMLGRLAVEDADVEPVDAIARLVDEAARRVMVLLEMQVRAADDPLVYQPRMAWLALRMGQLRTTTPSRELLHELVAFLQQWAGEEQK
ncbi:MAG: DNA primase [Acidimicrobiales bacterium]